MCGNEAGSEEGRGEEYMARCCVNWMQRTRRCFGGTTALTGNHSEQFMVSPHIQKMDTNMRVSIAPSQRLSATLRFLATGTHFSRL